MQSEIEWLGLIAGGLICLSTWPQLIKNYNEPEDLTSQSLQRQIFLILGNLLWVVYGVLNSAFAISIMCGLNAALNGGVLLQILLSAKRNNSLLKQQGD